MRFHGETHIHKDAKRANEQASKQTYEFDVNDWRQGVGDLFSSSYLGGSVKAHTAVPLRFASNLR